MIDELKRQAALVALEEIQSGMIVGLGSGSTAAYFIRELGGRVAGGLEVTGIPTSEDSRRLAELVGIRLTTLAQNPRIDVTVDGADEVSPELDLIKGLGGALVREKVVAHASATVVIVVDETKIVPVLGSRTGIPVEVVPFAIDTVSNNLMALGGHPELRRRNGAVFISDNGNYIVDWQFGPIADPAALERELKMLTGVVDSGLFCGVAQSVIVAAVAGVRRLDRRRK